MLFRVIFILFLLVIPHSLLAERLMFIDEAGNIHFVDHLNQVPAQYRSQITDHSDSNVVIRDPKSGKQIYPVVPKEQKFKKLKRQRDLEVKAKEKEEKIKQKELEKKKKQQFKVKRRQEKKKHKIAQQ